MTKSKKEALMQSLQDCIILSDKMFNEKLHSHPYIIGYLQGYIKETINTLKK